MGIIPAHAGSRNTPLWGADPGSSPRVRGADLHTVNGRNIRGIIPARAGSRRSAVTSATSSRDHPRACGEQPSFARSAESARGSSPRVRGAADIPAIHSVDIGIIPARAGSRPHTVGKCSGGWDHPRACGEQVLNRGSLYSMVGSSPRVRGAATSSIPYRRYIGIIPARAGSSIPLCHSRRCHRDHPRACGEQ